MKTMVWVLFMASAWIWALPPHSGPLEQSERKAAKTASHSQGGQSSSAPSPSPVLSLTTDGDKNQATAPHPDNQKGGNSVDPVQPFTISTAPDNPLVVSTVKDYWDKALVIGTVGLVLVGGFGIKYAYKTLKEMQAASKTTADQIRHFVASERPWLTVKVTAFDGVSPAIEMPPQNTIGLIHIAAPITNSGRTPAKVKYARASLKHVPFPTEGWGRPGQLPEVPDYSNSNVGMAIAGKDFVIAPGETKRVLYVILWSYELAKIKERKESLYVYGEIQYVDTLEGKECKTCFCEIYWVPEKGAIEPEGFMFSANLIPDAYICAT